MSNFGLSVFLVGTSHFKASSGIWCNILSQLPVGLTSNRPLTLQRSIFALPVSFIKAAFGRDYSVLDFHHSSALTKEVPCGRMLIPS